MTVTCGISATPSSAIPHTSLARTHAHLVVITSPVVSRSLSRALDKHAISSECRQTHCYNCSISIQQRVRPCGGLVRMATAAAPGASTIVCWPGSYGRHRSAEYEYERTVAWFYGRHRSARCEYDCRRAKFECLLRLSSFDSQRPGSARCRY